MFGNNQEKRREAFVDHFGSMALWLAFLLTVLAIPILFRQFEYETRQLAERLYGYEYAEYGFWGLWALTVPVVLYMIRATLFLSAVSGAIYLAQRLV